MRFKISKIITLRQRLSSIPGQCESDAIRKILLDIQQIRGAEFELILNGKMSRGQMINLLSEQANALPLYIGGIEGHPPPGNFLLFEILISNISGVGAIPFNEKAEIPTGAVVAAFVDDVWILAMIAASYTFQFALNSLTFLQNQTSQGKYSIRDIDDEHSRRIDIIRKRLIPLPTYRADPQRDGHALFPLNAIVLALYPQTTCKFLFVIKRSLYSLRFLQRLCGPNSTDTQ
jgi:SAGA-associated factor 29